MGRYSVNKWRAQLVKLNKIPKDLDPTTMWKLMEATQLKFRGKLNAHRPLKNTAIRIEVSPSREQSAGWTMDDWVKLADDFVKAFDAVDLSKMAQRESAKSTNLRNSQYFAMLHEDSDSGILHLHIIASRVDLDGKVNDDHCIHERAMIAAFRVSEERRWEQPEEVREGHIKILSFDCKSALEEMESFSWEAYEALLKAHGYNIEYRRDSDDKITGYTLLWGHSRFKSSILGQNRNLTPSRIQDTWKELHPDKEFKWQPVRQAETPLPVAPKTKKYPQPEPEEKKPVKPVPPGQGPPDNHRRVQGVSRRDSRNGVQFLQGECGRSGERSQFAAGTHLPDCRAPFRRIRRRCHDHRRQLRRCGKFRYRRLGQEEGRRERHGLRQALPGASPAASRPSSEKRMASINQ